MAKPKWKKLKRESNHPASHYLDCVACRFTLKQVGAADHWRLFVNGVTHPRPIFGPMPLAVGKFYVERIVAVINAEGGP